MGWGVRTENHWPSPHPPYRAANSQNPVERREEEPKITHPETHQEDPRLQPTAWRSPVSLATSQSGRAGRWGQAAEKIRKGSPEETESPRCAERRKESQVLLNKQHLSIQQENGAGSRQTPAPGSTRCVAWPGQHHLSNFLPSVPSTCAHTGGHTQAHVPPSLHTCTPVWLCGSPLLHMVLCP